METDDLLKLFENAVSEEHYFLEAHQDRVAFYSGLVTVIVAGTAVGFLQASDWYHFAALCVGPMLLFAVSANAIAGSFRLYQRFIEAVTVRAKIEQELGLTKVLSRDTGEVDSYWPSEPLVPCRHIESRKMYESSTAFIREVSGKGYHGITSRLFWGIQWLGVLMFMGLVAMAIWTALR